MAIDNYAFRIPISPEKPCETGSHTRNIAMTFFVLANSVVRHDVPLARSRLPEDPSELLDTVIRNFERQGGKAANPVAFTLIHLCLDSVHEHGADTPEALRVELGRSVVCLSSTRRFSIESPLPQPLSPEVTVHTGSLSADMQSQPLVLQAPEGSPEPTELGLAGVGPYIYVALRPGIEEVVQRV